MNPLPPHRPAFPGRFCAFFAALTISASARIWTNTDGVEIDADLVNATKSEVVIRMKSTGQDYTVPLAKLSPEDNAFVKAWLEKKPEPSGEPSASAAIDNWDDPWPGLISGEVTLEIDTVEENAGEERYVYQSPHYEYICDVELTANVVRRFAIMFEATHQFVQALPFSMQKAHDEGERHRILLFESKSDYIKNGGPEGSAGVYMTGKDVIMVPLTSLGVEKGAGGYRVDYDKSNKTLPHEIVHQITDREYFQEGARGWFSEGLSEYVALTPYRGGKFTVRGNQNEIKEYVTGFSKDTGRGRNLGEDIALPDLKEFFMQDYESFLKNGGLNYGSSALLAFYFFHWDGNEDAANIKAFLKALKAGKKGEDALEALLAGRTYDQLEEEITVAWRKRGVTFSFK